MKFAIIGTTGQTGSVVAQTLVEAGHTVRAIVRNQEAADKAAAKPLAKEKTIVCLKGKGSLKVIGKNPKCPAGYTVKK
jgi:uncharacterized protein YbjT (DUF2867 family)